MVVVAKPVRVGSTGGGTSAAQHMPQAMAAQQPPTQPAAWIGSGRSVATTTLVSMESGVAWIGGITPFEA